MTILELREKRNTAWNAAKAFLDSHRTEKGTLTAEDDATYSRMEQEIADLGKEIARLERQEALEAELNKPVNKPLTSSRVILPPINLQKPVVLLMNTRMVCFSTSHQLPSGIQYSAGRC